MFACIEMSVLMPK